MAELCAIAQLVSSNDRAQNLARAQQQIIQAASEGAKLILLPENFSLFSLPESQRQAETASNTPVQQWLAKMAKDNAIEIVAGSVPMNFAADGDEIKGGRIRSSSLVYNHSGALMARYDKVHLFDVTVDDRQGGYLESSVIEPGEEIELVQTAIGKVGLSICYDLRFAAFYQQLRAQGAEIFTVPSAFTAVTGEAHWQPLLQARAIENQCYVLAANQGGDHGNGRKTWGHSMIIDPWGRVLAQAKYGEALLFAEIDLQYLQQVRAKMPVYQHQRF